MLRQKGASEMRSFVLFARTAGWAAILAVELAGIVFCSGCLVAAGAAAGAGAGYVAGREADR